MSTVQQLWVLVAAAYVAGSVPFGLLVGLARGVDPRKAGSGNIGATNVGRLLGGRYFALVFVLDLLKGMLPCLAASWVVGRVAPAERGPGLYGHWLLVGFAAVFGHMCSLFLKFKGGKGVATSAGVTLGVFPDFTVAGAAVLLFFFVIFRVTRIVSLASMIAVCAFPVSYALRCVARGQAILGPRWPLMAFATLVAVMIVWKHRANIARLRAGTEPKFVKKTVQT